MATIQSTIELYDSFSPVLNNVMDAINLTIASVEYMQQSLGANMDMTSLDGATESIHQAGAAMAALNEQMANHSNANINISAPQPVQVPVHWQVDNMEIFTNTGVERFEQEVQSANAMLNVLNHTQAQITATAGGMDILPPQASMDMMDMQNRMQAIQQRIMQISSNPVNMGTEQANTELERMRTILSGAIEEQNRLNAALNNMDPASANRAYLNLSSTVSNMEQYLRNNTTEQGRFNQQIRDGTTASNGLLNSIKKMAGVYLSIRTVGEILNISDELTQTTARLNLMNNAFAESGMEQQELIDTIYRSAQDARASYSDMASVVARFGNNARDAFGSSAEVVDFANLIQKEMKIAGATTEESSAAMLQLSQALGSGVLRGDELNSIFEQAPNLIQDIADYMDVPIGQIREMAKEGELTADIVKSAVFAATDEINAKFEEIPMTWGDIWTSMKNAALMAFQPVLQKINDIANNQGFQYLKNEFVTAIAVIAYAILAIFEFVGQITESATEDIGGTSFSVVAFIVGCIFYLMGAIANAGAFLDNVFLGIMNVVDVVVSSSVNAFTNFGLLVGNIALGIWGVIKAVAENIAIAFENAINSSKAIFYGLAAVAFDVISKIAEALNKLPFIEFDVAGLDAKAAEYAAKSVEAANDISDYTSISDAWNKGFNTYGYLDTGSLSDITDAWNKGFNTYDYLNLDEEFDRGTEWVEGLKEKFANQGNDYTNAGGYGDSMANIANNTGSTADNTADIADALEITEEDLKYLRDIAEREVIDRTVLKSVTIDMSGMTNKVENKQDLDGIGAYLAKSLRQQMEVSMEGA